MPHLCVLDQNFPEPIVAALQQYVEDNVELVPGAPVLCPAKLAEGCGDPHPQGPSSRCGLVEKRSAGDNPLATKVQHLGKPIEVPVVVKNADAGAGCCRGEDQVGQWHAMMALATRHEVTHRADSRGEL